MKDSQNKFDISYKNITELKPYKNNSRTHTAKQVHQIAKSLKQFSFVNPILVDESNTIIAGYGRYLAAKELKMETVPTICISHLTKDEIRAYVIADNKLAQNAGWDKDILKIELDYLMNSELDFDVTITGFEIPEIDLIINHEGIEEARSKKEPDEEFFETMVDIPERVKKGDIWKLGEHKIYCGDALEKESYEKLLDKELAGIVFTDPPYNVKIVGNVTKQKHHKEFAEASGEMSEKEFIDFLRKSMELQTKYSKNGSIHYQCMDWRHINEILTAGMTVYSEFKNLCVWDKGTGGMGSLYRSQHELIFVFKNGTASHINNVELGVNGRYRTNVWKYPGMHASNPHAKTLVKLHPTVKPVSMIMDALLDCSSAGDIVLDSFGGSGSTLIAAERTKRRARLIELNPKFCDVILYRWEKLTGKFAELYDNKEVSYE